MSENRLRNTSGRASPGEASGSRGKPIPPAENRLKVPMLGPPLTKKRERPLEHLCGVVSVAHESGDTGRICFDWRFDRPKSRTEEYRGSSYVRRLRHNNAKSKTQIIGVSFAQKRAILGIFPVFFSKLSASPLRPAIPLFKRSPPALSQSCPW